MVRSKYRRKLKQRKPGPKLSPSNIEMLIKLVQERECIWNADCKDHPTKACRDNAWKEIRFHFDKQFKEYRLRAKWAELRTEYRKCVNKAKFKKKVTWKFFKMMRFIGLKQNLTIDDEIDYANYFSSSSSEEQYSIDPKIPTAIEDIKPVVDSKLTVAIIPTENSNLTVKEEKFEEIVCNNDCENSDKNYAFSKYLYTELKDLPES